MRKNLHLHLIAICAMFAFFTGAAHASFTYDGEDAAQKTEQQKPEISLSLYPNPVKDQLTIKIENATTDDFIVKIIDLTGKVVHDRTYNDVTEIKVDFSQLMEGIYIVNLYDTNNILLKVNKIQKM